MPHYYLLMTIDELPIIFSNARAHWREKHKDTKRWDNIIRCKVPLNQRPHVPLKKAQLTLVRCSSVCPDWDNLANSWKHVVDSLVTNKILSDDSFKVIGMPKFTWEKARPTEGKIVIEIRETY